MRWGPRGGGAAPARAERGGGARHGGLAVGRSAAAVGSGGSCGAPSALLAAFALWSGVTLAWSVAPDQTWAECNRAIGYVLVLVLAIGARGLGPRALPRWSRRLPRRRRRGDRVRAGAEAAARAARRAASLTSTRPGRCRGSRSRSDTGTRWRCWSRWRRRWRSRWPCSGGRPAMDAARGGRPFVLMLRRSRSPTRAAGSWRWCGAGSRDRAQRRSAALPGVARDGLPGRRAGGDRRADEPPADRRRASHSAPGSGPASSLSRCSPPACCCSCSAARRAIELERHVRVSEAGRPADRAGASPPARRRSGGGAARCGAVRDAGLGGTVSHAWHSFTTTRATSVSDPGRLLSADSENRWVWWKEAAGAFSDRPFGGWGAGSFGVVHLLYRRDTLSVQQPHSVPLQFLAETGIVGATLALLGLALLLLGAVRAVRRRRTRRRAPARRRAAGRGGCLCRARAL